MLYRNYDPGTDYYRYVEQEQTKEPVIPNVPTPKRNIPAYRVIEQEDISDGVVDPYPSGSEVAQRPLDVAQASVDLVGKCPLITLPAGEPIPRRCIVDPQRLRGVTAVGLSATATMTLGGALQVGDMVDVTLVRPPTEQQPAAIAFVGKDMLVLGIGPVPANQETNGNGSSQSSVIVVALPEDRWDDFVTKSIGTVTIIDRRPIAP